MAPRRPHFAFRRGAADAGPGLVLHVVGRLSAAIGKRQRRPGVDLVREGVGHAPPARAGALRVAGRARASRKCPVLVLNLSIHLIFGKDLYFTEN